MVVPLAPYEVRNAPELQGRRARQPAAPGRPAGTRDSCGLRALEVGPRPRLFRACATWWTGILNTHHEEPSASPRPHPRLGGSECVLMAHTNFNASNAPLPLTGQITLSVPVPCQRCHSARARRARAPAGGGSRKEGGEAEKGVGGGEGRLGAMVSNPCSPLGACLPSVSVPLPCALSSRALPPFSRAAQAALPCVPPTFPSPSSSPSIRARS